jgi:hypothetical protein
MIQAIETRYKGYRFRSRLEARWAIFFDALGIKWMYELEGLRAGRKFYLPDFYLPDIKRYIEIKPAGYDTHAAIPRAFLMDEHSPFIVIAGEPGEYDCYDFGDSGLCDEGRFACCHKCRRTGFTFWGWLGYIDGCTCWDDDRPFMKKYKEFGAWNAPNVLEAVERSRSARFEHGETPGHRR